MTIAEVLEATAQITTDASGNIASYAFRDRGVVGHIEARLDKSGGPSPTLWRIVWTIHWRSDRGQEQRDTSTDLANLLARFGSVNLETSHAASLEDLLRHS